MSLRNALSPLATEILGDGYGPAPTCPRCESEAYSVNSDGRGPHWRTCGFGRVNFPFDGKPYQSQPASPHRS